MILLANDRNKLTSDFVALGRQLADFGRDERSQRAITDAVAGNGWFTAESITSAVTAIREQMLREEPLRQWLARYPEVKSPKNVGIIMAGNIPLAGFFDFLCVVISGHECCVKPSSKDRALIMYIIELLRDIDPELPISEYVGQPIDAVIATGSDNARRHFAARYGDVPALLRGNRASAAVLTGGETSAQLTALAGDIFSYSGLGCRNVSHLLLPEGYRAERLTEFFDSYPYASINPKYINNFRQRRAMLRMTGTEYTQGRFYALRRDDGFPAAISEITYDFYASGGEARHWLATNDAGIQCVVHDTALTGMHHPRQAAFGCAQSPTLYDYADSIDTMQMLTGQMLAGEMLAG